MRRYVSGLLRLVSSEYLTRSLVVDVVYVGIYLRSREDCVDEPPGRARIYELIAKTRRRLS